MEFNFAGAWNLLNTQRLLLLFYLSNWRTIWIKLDRHWWNWWLSSPRDLREYLQMILFHFFFCLCWYLLRIWLFIWGYELCIPIPCARQSFNEVPNEIVYNYSLMLTILSFFCHAPHRVLFKINGLIPWRGRTNSKCEQSSPFSIALNEIQDIIAVCSMTV